jgi:hypothetical protein
MNDAKAADNNRQTSEIRYHNTLNIQKLKQTYKLKMVCLVYLFMFTQSRY